MWTESNTPSKIEGAGGADVPKALIYAVSIEKYAVKSVCGPGKEQQYQASIFPHNIIKRHVRRGHFEYDQFVYDCKR